MKHESIQSLAHLLVVGLLLGTAPLQAEENREAKPEEVKQVQLAGISLEGGLSEAPTPEGLFGQVRQNLRQTIARLEKAAGDDKIAGVVLELDGLQLGRAQLGELRDAIARTRKAGKKVYAQLDSGMTADYLLASACDQIVMPPSGTLALPGVRAEVTFFKPLLDKLGIQADLLHVGAYKGAAEPLTRDSLSLEVRENLTAMLDDYYQQMVETIAQDRDLSPERVKELIDTGLFTAEAAKQAGLVDRIAYRDELEVSLRDQLDAEELKLVTGYGKKKVEEDFSGPMGMVKLMQALMGADTKPKPSRGKKIAVVYAVGAITTGKSEAGLFGAETLGADTLIAALKKADQDDNVVAIVLRVDSPGGSALASDLIWREIVRIEKPIIASMGDTAASGGYYIAMGADKIYAGQGTLTGSIGVVGGKVAVRGLLDKVGIKTEVISRGKNSGIFAGSDRYTDEERAAVQVMMEDIYRQFTQKAAEGRSMELAELEKLAGGQVWTGRMAKENGLVDEIGTLEDAIAAAKKAAELKDDDKVEILELPKPTSLLDSLFGTSDTEATLQLPVSGTLPELMPYLQQAEVLRSVLRERAALLLPFQLEIQ